MRFRTRFLVTFLTAIAALGAQSGEVAPAPPTPKKASTDTYHGVQVVDDYRWLENWSDPEVRSWSEAQTHRANSYLESLPAYDSIYHRLEHLERNRSVVYGSMQYCGGWLFAMKMQPGVQQAVLVRMRSADQPASEHVVVDPNKLDPTGATSIDLFAPTRDGRLVAVVLSANGSQQGGAHVYEAATGKALPDFVPHIEGPTANVSIAWSREATGFYYTHYPEAPAKPEDAFFNQQIYFHKLGTAVGEDRYVIGKEFPRIAEIMLQSSDDSEYVLATVANGDGGEYEHFLLGPSGEWKQITHFGDNISTVVFGPDEALYMLSHDGAPRGKILRLPVATPELSHATTIIPEGDGAIATELKALTFMPAMLATRSRLYVTEILGGPMRVRIFNHQGKLLGKLPIGAVASLDQMVQLDGDDILFESSSYVSPPVWSHYGARTDRARLTALRMHSDVTLSDAEVVQEFALSKDGTKVPLTIIHARGVALNGKHPTLLLGYGGYGISYTPFFSPMLRLWLDAGGVYAIAHIRGGGEYGEEWHDGGRLTRKQNTFDDFAACAQHLIQRGYTTASKIGVEGGSNGGLTVVATMTQHPELFGAVVSFSGVYDMLRTESYPNGQFNSTEYGSVKDAEQFRAIYAYSPYQHVVDGTKYPAVLLMTGENDGRVDPAQSRKMTARLQAASTSKHPVLLVTFAAAGHGWMGAALKQKLAMNASAWTFLYHELGVAYRQRGM